MGGFGLRIGEHISVYMHKCICMHIRTNEYLHKNTHTHTHVCVHVFVDPQWTPTTWYPAALLEPFITGV